MKKIFSIILLIFVSHLFNAQNPLTTLGLDSTNLAKGAYSLRQLSSNYSGPTISIRKAGSTTTLDINFNNGIVDTNAIKTYCGSDTCYVYTWYDQSGNGLDMVQISLTQQPIIALNGTIIRINGLPSIFFDFDDSIPDLQNVICLKTTPFNLRANNSLSMTMITAAGVNNASLLSSTFVSKTNNNLPDPFDIYNSSFLVGNGKSCWGNGYYNSGMWNSMNQSNSFNIWGITMDGDINTKNQYPQNMPLSYYSYFNGYLNSAFYGLKPLYSSEQNSSMIIGSRSDGATALNGWVSEVILFPNYYGTLDHDSMVVNQVMEKVTNNLITYYNVDRGSNFSHDYNANFKRNELNQLKSGSLDNVVVAYSLRKLSDGYTNSVLTIRRASDNNYGEVKFDANGEVSNSSIVFPSNNSQTNYTLGEFCKNTDCFVVKWYNQSGDDSLYAYQDSINFQPRIVTNGILETMNGKSTIYFDTSITYGPTFLKTKPFQAFNDISDTQLGFDSYVAAGVKVNTSANAFFSKTHQNIPAPWDIYNDNLILGCGNPDYYNFGSCDLIKPINATSGFNIWQFYANPQMISTGPNQGVFEYPNSNLNSSSNTASQSMSFYTYYDAGHPIYIGSRQDKQTSLNGWVSELLIFSIAPKFRAGRQENLFENMMGYYDIGKTGNCLGFEYDKKNFITINPNNGVYKAGSAYTKEAWIYVKAGYNQQFLISAKDRFEINNYALVASNNNDLSKNVKSLTNIPINTWTHVAVTYDGDSTLTLYINGEFSNKTTSASTSSLTPTIYLGRNIANTYFFNGMMDEVRIWNIERSANDIKNNYNKIINQETGLVAYYDFNQGVIGGNNQTITTLLNNVVPVNDQFNGILNNFTLTGIISNWFKSGAGIK